MISHIGWGGELNTFYKSLRTISTSGGLELLQVGLIFFRFGPDQSEKNGVITQPNHTLLLRLLLILTIFDVCN